MNPEPRDSFAERELGHVNDWKHFLIEHPELLAASISPQVEESPRTSVERQWPKPLATHAFHGIAGEIVRAIEPHTEADPAALLFQFLCGFGNLVDRAPYTIADGSRHGCNLFAAIVGVSSKGRKGTAWNHVRRLLEAIDPEWAGNRAREGFRAARD
jgi:hypothetical protein